MTNQPKTKTPHQLSPAVAAAYARATSPRIPVTTLSDKKASWIRQAEALDAAVAKLDEAKAAFNRALGAEPGTPVNLPSDLLPTGRKAWIRRAEAQEAFWTCESELTEALESEQA